MSSSYLETYRVLPYLRRRKLARGGHHQKKDVPPFHLKRTTVQISTLHTLGAPDSVSMATLVLGDISPEGAKLFAGKALYSGQRVSLSIAHPRMLFMRGKVVFCREIPRESPVISQFPLRFRVLIAFDFKSAEERLALKLYLSQIAPLTPVAQVAL